MVGHKALIFKIISHGGILQANLFTVGRSGLLLGWGDRVRVLGLGVGVALLFLALAGFCETRALHSSEG